MQVTPCLVQKEDMQKGGDSAKITPHTNGDGNYTPPPRYVNSSCTRCNLHTYWMFVDLKVLNNLYYWLEGIEIFLHNEASWRLKFE
jgi:hypothetical protein